MRKLRDILRLHFAAALSNRANARAIGVSASTVSDRLVRARAADVGWLLPESLSDTALDEALYGSRVSRQASAPATLPDYAEVHRELRLRRWPVLNRAAWTASRDPPSDCAGKNGVSRSMAPIGANPRRSIVRLPLSFAALAIVLLGSRALDAEPIVDCVPKGNARPVCGFSNPEDMVALPGDQAILIGEYGASAEATGRLLVFELASEKQHTVYRGGQGKGAAEAGWGDPSCTTPPAEPFNSHGIDLVRRDDGRLQLLVIQHGSREAVELFEVLGAGTDWRVEWRGCVPAPPNASLNSVAAVSNGDFYTTQMIPLEPAIDLKKSIPRHITGHAFAWSQADTSFRKIGGTDGAMPNGIVTSRDGRFIYMNATAEHSVRKVEVVTGRELGRATVDMPDNARWAPDGRVLISSLARDLTPQGFAACLSIEQGACSIPFKIVVLDPDSMTIVETLYETDGAPMGAGTVGLRVGDELFIGSFHGDRILRVNLRRE